MHGKAVHSYETKDDVRFTFEVSWEVCNKIGGINTVIRSKAAVTVAELGDNYYLLGPFVDDMRLEVEVEEADQFYVRAAVQAMRERGIRVVTGRWLIEGNPRVVLFDIASARKKLAEWMTDFCNVTRIKIPDSDKESADYVMFGQLVTWFLGEFSCRHGGKQTVAHFHEWQAGAGCILTRTRGLEIGTIFTTHATLLGRHLCAGTSDFYNNLTNFDSESEARRRGFHHRYCIELAACHAAHIFTTVSRITQDECEHLLKRRPDIITPNGLNVRKFSAIHEFQNLHARSKEKINNFVQGHFYGHLNFDLDKTIYLFSAGRNEYFNKGVDLFLEGLAKLNYFLKRDNIDVTIVAFLIFPEETSHYNIDSLNGQAQHKKLRESVEEIQHKIGDRIFQSVLRGTLPGDKLLTRDDEVLLKNYLYQSKTRTTLPPVVTHNLLNEPKSDIMNHLKRVKLFNHHSDKVKVVYHPEFLTTTSPLLNIDYSDFVRGCHLGVFPSYYEPWGYTPAECTVMGIPSITTNLSGFGCFMAEHIADPSAYGIYIVDRRFKGPGESVDQLAEHMLSFAKQNRRQRIIQRNRTERLSELMDWNNLGLYYVKARHMSLKALDVSYKMPDFSDTLTVDTQDTSNSTFKYPRPASQPPSPTHSRRSSVDMDSDEETQDRARINGIAKKIMIDEDSRDSREARFRQKSKSLGDIMDMKHNVLGEAMDTVRSKGAKKIMLRELTGLSEVRPTEDVSLNEVKNHQGHVTCVHKELSDIVCTKEKKKTLLKEVEVRGEVKENKSVVLAELDKLSQIACNAGDDNVSLVNISVEKKKKEAALGEIELIGRSKSQKESMQRELTTISVARDAKCGALQEIRDIAQTKETKKGVMEDISKRKVVKDARNNVLSDINKIGSINANVFAAVKGQECEPLPRVYTASLGVISEINEMGQRKETKTEALKELVTVQKTKNVKASAMTELKGISDTKSKKEASLKEIRDRESSKESKNMAMAELKKVADIKEKVVGDAPIGLFEIDIAIHNKAMQDIDSLGKQKESKGEAMKELLTISSSKVTKEKVLGEINQLGKTRSAKAGVHRELKRNIENMENEPTRQNVLGDIAAIGQEKEQSLSNLEKTITKKQNHSSILSEIAGIQKTKEQGQQDVENNLKEKLEKAKLKEQNAASLDEIRKIKEEQETGRENLEAHFAKHVNKQGE